MEASLGPQVLSTKRTEPAFGFGKSTPVEIVDNTPGPGHGHIDSVGRQTLSLHKTAPDVKFGTAPQRPPIGDSHSPGPGAYTMPSSLKSQSQSRNKSMPSYSMSSRHKEVVAVNDKLGPGLCREDTAFGNQHKGDKMTAPCYSFGTGKRGIETLERVPGPGAYNVNFSPYRTAPAIGLHFRNNTTLKQADVVGPGRCREDSGFGRQAVSGHRTAPGFSMTTRKTDVQRESAPPPGTYETTSGLGRQAASNVSTAPSYTISSRHPMNFSPIGPGPGSNNPYESFGDQKVSLKSTAPKFSFGTSNRPAPVNASQKFTPGPSAYTVSGSLVHQSTGKSISGRVKFGAMYDGIDGNGGRVLPGPGNYDADANNIKTTAPAYGFGKAKVRRDSTSKVPGPGKYDTSFNALKTTAPSYSLSGRHDASLKPADTQGPGRCRSDTAIGKQVTSLRRNSPAVVMGGRLPNPKPSTEVPGPGSYGDMKLAYMKSVPPPKKEPRRSKVVLPSDV